MDETIERVRDTFQYIEMTPIPNTEIVPFLEYDLLYIIHITTEREGLNIADKQKERLNRKIIDNCIEWADKLDAQYLILHPGFGSMNTALSFLGHLRDERILIENMPRVGLNNENMVGYTPEQIETLMDKKFGFCLDFGHAIKAAVSLNVDYNEHVNEFLKLEPTVFHISDGKLCNEKDEHLAVGDGEYDFEFLMNCVKRSKSSYVTLEIPRTNLDSFDEDFENLEKLKLFINSYVLKK
ncbi:MAG: TIM barrel protein [Theionarchaea archaeon]|nr:TIM barrel protein [Theionarchaea archaeon]